MKTLVQSLFFERLRPATFSKKETMAQVLSCEFRKIVKNTISFRTPLVAAFVMKFVFEAGETLRSKGKWSLFNKSILSY